MKPFTYISTILAVLLSACNSTDRNENSSVSIALSIPEPDIEEKLKQQKAAIDSLFNHSTDKLLGFVKQTAQDELLQITNSNSPENVETTFNILKDSMGHILTIYEIPFSESGDWAISYAHYFDQQGKAFAFERQTNFYNSICTDGMTRETITEFFDENFKPVEKL